MCHFSFSENESEKASNSLTSDAIALVAGARLRVNQHTAAAAMIKRALSTIRSMIHQASPPDLLPGGAGAVEFELASPDRVLCRLLREGRSSMIGLRCDTVANTTVRLLIEEGEETKIDSDVEAAVTSAEAWHGNLDG